MIADLATGNIGEDAARPVDVEVEVLPLVREQGEGCG